VSLCRLFSKSLFAQKLEIPVPPRRWITEMIELLGAVEGEEIPTTLRNSDAYKRIWRLVAGLSLEEPYWGKQFCWFDFYSFMSNKP
jgi:hypothetical protein